MVVITQLVCVHPGKESVFDDFEAVAIPLIGKHGGELLLRLRRHHHLESTSWISSRFAPPPITPQR